MILVVVEQSDGTVDRASLTALAFGRHLAGMLGAQVSAVAFGPSAEAALAALGPAGVVRGWAIQTPSLDGYAPAAWARGTGQLSTSVGARIILGPGTQRGNEVMAHVAAQLGLPMAANCLEVRSADPFVVMRQRWGGSVLEEARLDASVRCLTVAENAPVAELAPVAPSGEPSAAGGEPSAAGAEPSPAGAEPVLVGRFVPALSHGDLRSRVMRTVPRASAGIPLAGARVVVGGGRGVGSAAAFGPLEELAALLGGAVGVSRVVTSAGWRPHTEQVGQTGTRIAPEVYLACGISGAIQHIVGCAGARTIIAINTDPEAPILSRASYAVIGDLHAVVPAVSAEIRRVRGGG